MTNLSTLILAVLVLAPPTFAIESVLCDKQLINQHSFSNSPRIRDINEFSIITWNAEKLNDEKFIPDLIRLGQYSDLILIQESIHSASLQKTFSEKLEFYFSFNRSFCITDEQATGVMNMSRYPLEDNLTLVSPGTEPFTFTPKVSGYSTITVPEIGTIHIINTHGLNFNFGSLFKEQINQIAEFISLLQGPVIWAGDFNTWSGSRKKHLDNKNKALGMVQLIPTNDSRSLKLDHIYVRGLEAVSIEVLNNIKSSDHYPLRAVFKKN